jgi:hypothetical protein
VNSELPAQPKRRNTRSDPQTAPTALVIVIVSNMLPTPRQVSRGIYMLPLPGFKV